VEELLSLKEAAQLISRLFNRNISEANISYLINYGRVNGYRKNGKLLVSVRELKEYYQKKQEEEKRKYESYLGKEINWNLSFEWVKESERTKHVHRLHPYKGKFIPQLVEYFLDGHTDEFKREVFFKPGLR